MAIFAIGDLHLSLGTDKPMDIFGGNWDNYIERILDGFKIVSDDDTVVLCGDLTWSMTLDGSINDFDFIDKLPGSKIILKGNHDYWWSTVSKANSFFQKNGFHTLSVLHNNSFFVEDISICGTRGWFYDEATGGDQDKKVMLREIARLEASLLSADNGGEKVCFLHYPPLYNNYVCEEILALFKKYSVRECFYGHIHGHGHRRAITGLVGGVNYRMVSADYLNFVPERVR